MEVQPQRCYVNVSLTKSCRDAFLRLYTWAMTANVYKLKVINLNVMSVRNIIGQKPQMVCSPV